MATTARLFPVVTLSDLAIGQEADFFALLTAKEELTTREGKPYFKVTFRDAGREVSFPIWQDSAWAVDCRQSWAAGTFYKLRAIYRESNFGPQLEIKKIRAVIDADAAEGFNPLMLQPKSRFDAVEMFDDLIEIAKQKIADKSLQRLTIDILKANRETLLTLPAARKNHHAYVGGWLEHTLSVTRTAAHLADKYDDYYPDLQPRLDKSVVVAGAILHDIGKDSRVPRRADGRRLHRRRRVDRPHAARPRHRPRVRRRSQAGRGNVATIGTRHRRPSRPARMGRAENSHDARSDDRPLRRRSRREIRHALYHAARRQDRRGR